MPVFVPTSIIIKLRISHSLFEIAFSLVCNSAASISVSFSLNDKMLGLDTQITQMEMEDIFADSSVTIPS